MSGEKIKRDTFVYMFASLGGLSALLGFYTLTLICFGIALALVMLVPTDTLK